VLDGVCQWPGLRRQQYAWAVAISTEFSKRSRHRAHIMRNNYSACLGRQVQNGDIINRTEWLGVEIRCGQAAQKTANDGSTQVIVSLEFPFTETSEVNDECLGAST
jgi:hypothetical protein